MIFYKTKKSKRIILPLYNNRLKASFPNSVEGYISEKLDLSEYMIRRPESTFMVQVEGNSMTGVGILPKDVLIIDRAEIARDGSVVMAIINKDFTIKTYRKINGKIWLIAANPAYKAIEVEEDMKLEIWGVVVGVIRKMILAV